MIDYFYECGRCGTQYNSRAHDGLPDGWSHQGQMTICADCGTPAQDPLIDQDEAKGVLRGFAPSREPQTFVGKDTDHVRHGFFAVHMPNRQAVAFHFDRGFVEFSIEEAEDIAAALIGAVTIAKGLHPAQTAIHPASPAWGSTAAADLSGLHTQRIAA